MLSTSGRLLVDLDESFFANEVFFREQYTLIMLDMIA